MYTYRAPREVNIAEFIAVEGEVVDHYHIHKITEGKDDTHYYGRVVMNRPPSELLLIPMRSCPWLSDDERAVGERCYDEQLQQLEQRLHHTAGEQRLSLFRNGARVDLRDDGFGARYSVRMSHVLMGSGYGTGGMEAAKRAECEELRLGEKA